MPSSTTRTVGSAVNTLDAQRGSDPQREAEKEAKTGM